MKHLTDFNREHAVPLHTCRGGTKNPAPPHQDFNRSQFVSDVFKEHPCGEHEEETHADHTALIIVSSTVGAAPGEGVGAGGVY